MSNSARRGSDGWLPYSPALLLLVTTAISGAVYYGDEGRIFASSPFLQIAYPPGNEPQRFIGHALWLATEFAFILALITACAMPVVLTRTHETHGRRGMLFALFLLLGVSAVVATIWPNAPFTPAYTQQLIEGMRTIDVRIGWLLSVHSALLVAAISLSAAFCGLLLVGLRELAPFELGRRQHALRILIYVLAASLVLGVTQVYAFYLIPLRLMESARQGSLREVAAVVTILNGVLLSALLLSLIAPTMAILRFHTLRLAEKHEGAPHKRIEWLKQQGLESSWRTDLASILSVLSPALTSLMSYFLAIR